MAIAYKSQGAGNGTETTGAALNLVCPATVDVNDILIAHVSHTALTTAPSTPADWTLLSGPHNIGQATAVGRSWVFGKLAVGTEDGTTVSFGTAGGTNGRWGRIYSFSGWVSGTITDVVPAASFSNIEGETATISMPSVTTTVDGAMAVALCAIDDNNTQASATGESGGDWTEAVAEYTNSTFGPQGVSAGIQTAAMASIGTISGGSFSQVSTDESSNIGFEIRPNAPSVDSEINVFDSSIVTEFIIIEEDFNINVFDICVTVDELIWFPDTIFVSEFVNVEVVEGGTETLNIDVSDSCIALDITIIEILSLGDIIISEQSIVSDVITIEIPLPGININVFDLCIASEYVLITKRIFLTTGTAVDTDDLCIWVHPTDKSLSTIIGSDKTAGRLFVYGLEGNLIQDILLGALCGNVDIAYNFRLGGVDTDFICYNDRTNNTIVFYKINPSTRELSTAGSFSDGGMTGGNYGLCLYKSPYTGKYFVFCSSQTGVMKQWELYDNSGSFGAVGDTHVRTWTMGTITEGLVADYETAILYISVEDVGVYEIGAEPDAGTSPSAIASMQIGQNGLTADLEGIAIYYKSNGEGYIVISNQLQNDYPFFKREGSHDYIKTIGVTGSSDGDGVDITNVNFVSSFPQGFLAVHNGTSTIILVDMRELELTLDSTYYDPPFSHLFTSVIDQSIVSDVITISVDAGIESPNISVFDSSIVTEFITIENLEAFLLVSDLSIVTENITFNLETFLNILDLVVVIENITFNIEASINTFDSSIVTEEITIFIPADSEIYVNIFDSPIVTEFIFVENLETSIDIFDSSITLDVIIIDMISFINILDSNVVIDIVNVDINSFIDVSDLSIITEDIITYLEIFIAIFDLSIVAEFIPFTIGIDIDTSDLILVTENINVLLEFNITSFDLSIVSDVIIIDMDSFINVSDLSIITELILLSNEIDINVLDLSTVTDIITITNLEVNINVFSLSIVLESLNIFIITGGAVAINIVEDVIVIEVIILEENIPDINIIDSVIVTDVITLLLESFINTFDNVFTIEFIQIELPFYSIDVQDFVVTIESIQLHVDAYINLYDLIISIEFIESNLILEINNFDLAIASEFLITLIGSNEINIIDTIIGSEVILLSSEIDINLFDNTLITEFIQTDVLFLLFVFDDVIVTENIQSLVGLNISILETVSITEYILNIIPGGLVIFGSLHINNIIVKGIEIPIQEIEINLPVKSISKQIIEIKNANS